MPITLYIMVVKLIGFIKLSKARILFSLKLNEREMVIILHNVLCIQ
jgi:hypothetical protein